MSKQLKTSLLIAVLLCQSLISSSQDSTAIRIVNNQLDTIEVYLKKPYPKVVTNVLRAAWFMSDLTGISSTSGGNVIGPDPPNESDLRSWRIWLIRNSKYVIWDERLKVIILNKSIHVPEY